jgi:hypothetical protein
LKIIVVGEFEKQAVFLRENKICQNLKAGGISKFPFFLITCKLFIKKIAKYAV